MCHFLRSSALFSLAVLLTGCNLVPERDPAEPPLTRQAFQSRIDRLETTLSNRCDVGQLALQEQQREQQALMADVRELGGLLRDLRGDLASRDDESSPRDADAAACRNEIAQFDNKEVLGRSEWIGLPEVGTYLRARIDSGANTSSISAIDITEFERDGEDWVRFKLGLVDSDSVVDSVRDQWIEAPVERRVRVIQTVGEESRPVISLLMTLGPIRETVEFTLTDRTSLDYPILLGRRFLMDIAVVDVAEQYLHERPEYADGSAGAAAEGTEASDAAQPDDDA
ncbi:ATP-dependent zinc protease [Halomonas sp. NO4]|uniref:ATP-dependent zinc protease family protein n=1 Tax=Halomonas sp. NO4 TaxID=2484813 RepID=UPI0013D758C8|nr:ATP-dependent zinc protease [Halomonas sp. NO4]